MFHFKLILIVLAVAIGPSLIAALLLRLLYQFLFIDFTDHQILLLIANLSLIPITWVGFILIPKQSNERLDTHVTASQLILLTISFVAFSVVVSNVHVYFQLLIDNNYLIKYWSAFTPLFDTTENGIDWWSVCLAFTVSCLFIPFIEELAFRDLIFRALNKKYSFVVASLLSSALFGVLHEEIIPPFLLGLFLSYVYRFFGLKYVVYLHVIHNSFVLAWHLLYFWINDRHMVFVNRDNYEDWTSLPAIIVLIVSLLLIRFKIVSLPRTKTE